MNIKRSPNFKMKDTRSIGNEAKGMDKDDCQEYSLNTTQKNDATPTFR